jgi:hypothetical protein
MSRLGQQIAEVLAALDRIDARTPQPICARKNG